MEFVSSRSDGKALGWALFFFEIVLSLMIPGTLNHDNYKHSWTSPGSNRHRLHGVLKSNSSPYYVGLNIELLLSTDHRSQKCANEVWCLTGSDMWLKRQMVNPRISTGFSIRILCHDWDELRLWCDLTTFSLKQYFFFGSKCRNASEYIYTPGLIEGSKAQYRSIMLWKTARCSHFQF